MISQEAEMKKKARTVAQDAAKLNSMLDSIWRMGDGDECSIKHIGWATAALGAGLDWSDGLDYSRPWAGAETWVKTENLVRRGADDEGDILNVPVPAGATVFEDWTIIPWTAQLTAMRERQLAKKWAKVVEYRDTFGIERFDQMMRSTKFNWYYESFLPDMQATK